MPSTRKSYTKEEKIKFLDLLNDGHTKYMISKEYGICPKILRRWVSQEQDIRSSKRGTRKMGSGRTASYPDMEAELYKQFMEARSKGFKVKRWWFQMKAKQLMSKMHPGASFQYSDCWFDRFKTRHDISFRSPTNCHHNSADDKRDKVADFHRFLRKVSSRGDQTQAVGRYSLGDIHNVDQSPLPFAFLSGKTYESKGQKDVWVRGAGSGLDKRQCTLQAAVSADGVNRFKPVIVFRGTGQRIKASEKQSYDSRVITRFQEKAWVDEAEMKWWIRHVYTPGVKQSPRQQLLVGDSHRAQITDSVKEQLKTKSDTQLGIIPGGCTDLVQPLDRCIFAAVKFHIERIQNQHMMENLDAYLNGSLSASKRRVLITKWVGEAWSIVTRNKALIQRSFVKCGIALPVDGSGDHMMNIDKLADYTFPAAESDD